MLSEIIKEHFIQLNIEADDWEDAIRKSAKPLLEGGMITKGYIDKIIEISETAGPYIVITKHIALPHAPSEYGARKLAMGLTTLRDPVTSGNTENDPVQFLFCLSATDTEKHLAAMADLAQLIENQEFLDLLNEATDPKAILEFIKKQS